MPTRRQEKVARIVREAVSDALASHLSDPRIEGLVSVTSVDMSPNLKRADVYLTIYGKDEKSEKKTFIAISHARTKIQSILAPRITSKFCPVLHFFIDEKFKKTLETMNLIDKVVRDRERRQESEEQGDDSDQN